MSSNRFKELVNAAAPEWNGQILKNVVYQGFEIPGYKIANDGLVISYKQRREGKPLMWHPSSMSHAGREDPYPQVNIRIPPDCAEYLNPNNTSWNGKTVLRTIETHRLVAENFLDLNDSYPSEFAPYWDTFPVELKKLIRKYFTIDHIDDNKLNSHVSNLRLVSSRCNSPDRKKFQGVSNG